MRESYDVVVAGGGPAGLSAALTLARSRRSVLVVDAGSPRNAPAAGVHNYLTRDGLAPADLLATGRAEVTAYGGEVITGTVVSAKNLDTAGFQVFLEDQTGPHTVAARRLLVATGLVDELPDIPGVSQRWGRDVLHCPFCHGWEVRDQAIGVLSTGPFAVHQALLFRQLSADVTLFTHTGPPLTDDQRARLAAMRIAVVDGEVAALEVTDDRLTGVRLSSGTVVPREAVTVQPRFIARGELVAGLGLAPVERVVDGYVIGSYVPASPTGATEVPGLWVAGNVTDLMGQVIVSAAAGLGVGAALNGDLVEEDVRLALAG